METATLIINIVLSILTLIVVFLAWGSLRIAAEASKQSQRTLDITKETIALLKLDFERRFRPLKFRIIEFDVERANQTSITIQFTNDGMQTNRITNIGILQEDEQGKAAMSYTARDLMSTSILPGEIKNIKYWGSSPKDYSYVFEGKMVILEFVDSFGNEYRLENPQGNTGVIMEGKKFYGF